MLAASLQRLAGACRVDQDAPHRLGRDGKGIWDVARRRRIALLTEAPEKTGTVAYGFSRDGRFFVTGHDNGSTRIWDARTWSKLTLLRGHVQPVRAVAFSPDSRHLATGSDDTTVQVWETDFRSEPTVLRGDAGAVYSIAFTPDGETLAVGTVDGVVKFWNVRARREVTTLKATIRSFARWRSRRMPESWPRSPSMRRCGCGGHQPSVKRIADARASRQAFRVSRHPGERILRPFNASNRGRRASVTDAPASM
jgi:hypothetical protein